MCFTWFGRMQTRLFSLVWPLGVTILFATPDGDGEYFKLFTLMVVIGFALDAGVYYWTIR